MIAIVKEKKLTAVARRGRPRNPAIEAMGASMARDYRRGLTIREVAAKHGVSYGATRTRLLDRQVPMRGRARRVAPEGEAGQ